MNNKLARVTGIGILFLAGLVFGQIPDTFKINVYLAGDLGNNFTITATPISPKLVGGTYTSTWGHTYRLSLGWTGKISVTGLGFSVTPKDTQIRALNTSGINITFTVRDTMRPVVKIGHLNGTTIYANQPFSFYDSVQENSKRISIMKHEYSVNGGITWDSACFQQRIAPDYFYALNSSYSGLNFTGYLQTFTPTIASNNFKLRAIVVDYFGWADTDMVTLKVTNTVSTLKLKKNAIPKRALGNSPAFDLSGRKVLTAHGHAKFYIRNNQRHLTIHQ